MSTEPIFALPPFTVTNVFIAYSETIDWGLKLLKVPDAWKTSKGKGIKVAVLDTGAALTHPDLRDAIKKSRDFTRSRSGVADISGHSTHCCGVIAARENSSGVIGIAPEAHLYVGKVLGDNGTGKMHQIVDGINWAIGQKVDIISMSLGSPSGHPDLEAAINRALKENILVCCAAGNEGPDDDTVGYPAKYPGVVSVAAINNRENVSRFSSRGSRVDVAAPGEDILSCWPPRSLAKLSGSSMAAPFVAGVAALMRSYAPELVKNNDAFLDLLKKCATDLGPKGWDNAYGWGVVNPTAMLEQKFLIKNIGGSPKIISLTGDDLSPTGLAKVATALGHKPADYRLDGTLELRIN